MFLDIAQLRSIPSFASFLNICLPLSRLVRTHVFMTWRKWFTMVPDGFGMSNSVPGVTFYPSKLYVQFPCWQVRQWRVGTTASRIGISVWKVFLYPTLPDPLSLSGQISLLAVLLVGVVLIITVPTRLPGGFVRGRGELVVRYVELLTLRLYRLIYMWSTVVNYFLRYNLFAAASIQPMYFLI